MRDEHPEIQHEYDMWHIVKSVKKSLLKSKNAELLPWVRHIANHLWYCASTCAGDAFLLKEKWMSILHHITNNHEWVTCETFHKCEHDPYPEDGERVRPWLRNDSKAFVTLQHVVMNKVLLKTLDKVSYDVKWFCLLIGVVLSSYSSGYIRTYDSAHS